MRGNTSDSMSMRKEIDGESKRQKQADEHQYHRVNTCINRNNGIYWETEYNKNIGNNKIIRNIENIEINKRHKNNETIRNTGDIKN